MTAKERSTLLKRAITTYGTRAQADMAVEEIQLLSPFPLSLRYCVGVSEVSLLNMRAKLDALA